MLRKIYNFNKLSKKEADLISLHMSVNSKLGHPKNIKKDDERNILVVEYAGGAWYHYNLNTDEWY